MLLNTTFGKSLENEVKGQVTSKELLAIIIIFFNGFCYAVSLFWGDFDMWHNSDIFLQMYARVIMF